MRINLNYPAQIIHRQTQSRCYLHKAWGILRSRAFWRIFYYYIFIFAKHAWKQHVAGKLLDPEVHVDAMVEDSFNGHSLHMSVGKGHLRVTEKVTLISHCALSLSNQPVCPPARASAYKASESYRPIHIPTCVDRSTHTFCKNCCLSWDYNGRTPTSGLSWGFTRPAVRWLTGWISGWCGTAADLSPWLYKRIIPQVTHICTRPI